MTISPRVFLLVILLSVTGLAQSNPPSESEKAAEIRKAAERGDAEAQVELGDLYRLGEGVPQDYTQAALWYRKAAEQQIARLGAKVNRVLEFSAFQLGLLYGKGQGVPQDYGEAAKWFRVAAELGDADAQFRLGYAYNTGQGVPQDYEEAAKWYRMAAEQGNASGQVGLAWAYHFGQGVPQDYTEAVKWFRKGAEQGDHFAQYTLGERYYYGSGVPQDYVQAHMWANLAAAGSTGEERNKRVKLRDEIAAKMTPEQLAEAQRLAREWKPSPAK